MDLMLPERFPEKTPSIFPAIKLFVKTIKITLIKKQSTKKTRTITGKPFLSN